MIYSPYKHHLTLRVHNDSLAGGVMNSNIRNFRLDGFLFYFTRDLEIQRVHANVSSAIRYPRTF
jgi:hypothetical protein